jgi:hypothetical protein
MQPCVQKVGIPKILPCSLTHYSLSNLCFPIDLSFPRWNEVIGESSNTMQKLRLFLGGRYNPWTYRTRMSLTEDERTELKQLRRRYASMKVSLLRFSNETYAALKTQVYIRKLELYETSISHSTYLAMLKKLTLLEDLSATFSIVLGYNRNKPAEAVHTPALKSIKLRGSKEIFLAHIRGFNVTSFSISNAEDPVDFEFLDGFLSSLSSLEDLSLSVRNNWNDIYKFLQRYESSNSVLKKFGLRSWPTRDEAEGIIKFLRTQKQTLKGLKLYGVSEHLRTVYDFVLRSMDVKSLVLDPKYLPSSDLFYDDVLEKKNLSMLKFKSTRITQEVAEKFFRMCRHVELLKLSNVPTTKDLLQLILSLPKLSSLEFKNSLLDPEITLMSNSLQSLTLDEPFDFKSVSTYNLCLPNLRTLSLYTRNFHPTFEFVKTVKINCPHLNTLKLLRQPFAKILLRAHLKCDGIEVQLKNRSYHGNDFQDNLKINFVAQ